MTDELPFSKEDYGNLREMMVTVKNIDTKLDSVITDTNKRLDVVEGDISTIKSVMSEQQGFRLGKRATYALIGGAICGFASVTYAAVMLVLALIHAGV